MIVLDTHVLIWAVQDDSKLGEAATALIEGVTADNGLVIPAICAWESAQIERRSKIDFPGGVLHWFERILAAPVFTLAGFDPAIAIDSVQMDWAHKDPADRIIVATARRLGMPLLTADGKILDFATQGHVQAIDARR